MSQIKKIKNGWAVILEWKGKEYWRHFHYKVDAQKFQNELMDTIKKNEWIFTPDWMHMSG